jgi:hypothetical protein
MGFCTSCGAQRVAETDRFCRSCGVPHDPVGVPAGAPVTAVPPAAPPPAAPPTQWQPPAQQPAAPYNPVVGGGGGSGVGAGTIVAVVGVVVALIVAGFVGWHFFWPRGGAGSPEDAAEKLVMAAATQDAVGMLDMVSPAEVEGLDDVYAAARDLAEEEELVEGDGVTEALTVELSDLEWDVDELGDDLARVTLVGGEYDVSWDPDKLPERLDFLADVSEDESESGDLEELFDGDEPSVTTVKIDGRWYVTLFGTIADHTYAEGEAEADDEDFSLEEPDWDLAGADVEPITGDGPEEVIENLVSAINSGDAEEILANFPEDLVRPLRPYVPVIEDLKDEANWDEGEIGLSVDATGLDLETEDLDDGKVKVVVNEGSFSGSVWEDDDYGYDSDSGSVEIDGDCVEAYENGEYQDGGCIGDEQYVDDLGVDEFFFVLTEVDGGYQLDPTATLVEYAAVAVENFSGDMIDEIISDIEDEVSYDEDGDY